MEFARTLLALDFCPYLYDVFFVSLYDAQAASDLYRSICRLCSQPSIEETMSPQELREALGRRGRISHFPSLHHKFQTTKAAPEKSGAVLVVCAGLLFVYFQQKIHY